jgi:hypothetical protein
VLYQIAKWKLPDAKRIIMAKDTLGASRGFYQTLPEGCIRLLTIEPGVNTPPECSLEIIPLSEAGERGFEALSYTWGKGRFNTIKICDQDFVVTQNLYDAILALRQKDCERCLWVDAVCINQKDYNEKRVQIPMMADIYKGAETVVAWLGSVDAGIAPALRLLASAARLENEEDRSAALLGKSADVYVALAAIMDCDYWYRAWIVQEIAYAQQLRIYCGHEIFSYGYLKWSLDTLPRMFSTMVPVGAQPIYAFSLPTFRERILRLNSLDQRKMDPEFYLESLIDRHCTIPQDSVFAYFCLFPDEIQECITVDYRSEAKAVLLQAISGIIECTGSLTVLGIRSRQLPPDDSEHAWQHTMPSWCPYVGTSFDTCAMDYLQNLPEFDIVIEKPKFDPITQRLLTFGFTIGIVTEMVTNRVRRDQEKKEATSNEASIWYKLRQYFDWTDLGLSNTQCRGNCTGQQIATVIVGPGVVDAEDLAYVNNFFYHTRHRRICRIKSTSFDDSEYEKYELETVALVPDSTRKKDRICWIKGCPSAVVLREVKQTDSGDTCFSVVGEAIVEGLDELKLSQVVEAFMLR